MMNTLKNQFTIAAVPDGKTAEREAAADFENLVKGVDGVTPMSW